MISNFCSEKNDCIFINQKLLNSSSKKLIYLDKKSEYDHDKTKWIEENRKFIIEMIHHLVFSGKFKMKTFEAIYMSCGDPVFFGNSNDYEKIFSEMSDKDLIIDREISNYKTFYILAIYIRILDSLDNGLFEIERLCTAFRNTVNADIYGIINKYSASEKILRCDPSGIYKKMTNESKSLINALLRNEAKKKHIDEKELALRYLELAKKENKSICEYIYKKKNNYLYFPLIFGLTIILDLYFYIHIRSIFLTVILILPLYFAIKRIIDFIFSVCIKSYPLLELKIDKIENCNKTIAAITAVISDKNDIDDFFKKLLIYKLNNKNIDDQIYFGAIIDFKASISVHDKDDDILIDYIDEKLNELNSQDDSFFAFIRKRKYSRSEEIYMGRERKRGAIEDFISLIDEKNPLSKYNILGNFRDIKNSKYLILLDSDTEIGIMQAKRLIGIISHPMNKALISERNGKKFVSSGYGIIQPIINTSLSTPIKTRFQKIYANGSGENLYEFASFNNYQTLFNKGIFCGKGIIDIDAYSKLIENKFQDEKILSHDIPEGAILSTALATNIHLSDSYPETPFSDYKRMHRWIRGDVQNLSLIGEMKGLYKYIIIENFISYFVPLFEIILIIGSAFIGRIYSEICSLLIIFFHFIPLCTSVTGIIFTGNFNNFKRHFTKKIRNSILNTIYISLISLSEIVFKAIYYSDAIIRALYRMIISKKKLLQWQISSKTNSSSISMLIPSVIVSSALLFAVNNIYLLFIILMCIFHPVLTLFLSKEYSEESFLKESDRAELLRYAKLTYNFFDKNVSEDTNFLPPDNVQFEPYEKIAPRTSPTNIGLYLLSLLASCDLGIIDIRKFIDDLEKTLKNIYSLEKYKGHLYNWYDITTLMPIGDKLISSVDSGNFIASLIILMEGIKEYQGKDERIPEIISYISAAIDNTDFRLLFDSKEQLFYVGIFHDGSHTDSHYDMYMSEARILSFISIIKGDISFEHWKKLKRTLVSYKGRVGQASWTGTAFEYFLAAQFMPVIENSFDDESLDFALFCQMKDYAYFSPEDKIFGKSECGYYCFDDEYNYQYKAFGTSANAIQKDFADKKVYAPYASFLMLICKNRDILKNIKNFEKHGMLSIYGFYEAVQFNSNFIGDYNIVKSCMAHHSGMIMISILNCLNNNILPKRLLNYKNAFAKKELLCERFPLESKASKFKNEKNPENRIKEPAKKEYIFAENMKETFILSDGKSTFILFSDGNIIFFNNENLIFDSFISKGLKLSVNIKGKDYDLTGDQNIIKKINYSESEIRIESIIDNIQINLSFSIIPNKSSLLLSMKINGMRDKIKTKLILSPIISKRENYIFHKEFENLQLELSGKNKKYRIRKRSDDLNHKYLSIMSTQMMNFRCEDIKGNSADDIAIIDGDIEFMSEFSIGGYGRIGYIFHLEDTDQIDINSFEIEPDISISKNDRKIMFSTAHRIKDKINFDKSAQKTENEILYAISYPSFAGGEYLSYSKNELWKYGISGDYDIVSFYIGDVENEAEIKELKNFISAVMHLYILGFRFDSVIIHQKEKDYFLKKYSKIKSICEDYNCDMVLNKRSGIHIISDISGIECDLFKNISSYSNFKSNSLVNIKGFVKKYKSRIVADKVGKFIEKGFEINESSLIKNDKLYYILANKYFGSVISDKDLGYTWYRNSALGRITDRNSSEKIIVKAQGNRYDLISYSNKVVFKEFFAIYEGVFFDIKFRIFVMNDYSSFSKKIFIEFNKKLENIQIGYSFNPESKIKNIKIKIDEKYLYFKSAIKNDLYSSGFLYANKGLSCIEELNSNLIAYQDMDNENIFGIGAYISDEQKKYIEKINEESNFKSVAILNKDIFDEIFGGKISDKSFRFLYQTYISRFLARCGPYQPGGAFGFRDQLQDIIAICDINKEDAFRHIIRAAAHQFYDGDVLHWWHPYKSVSGSDMGLRSKCSDDYLWLIYSASEYIENTGDNSILDISLPYLSGEALLENQNEKYAVYFQNGRENLSKHLDRAALLFINRGVGENNLPFILRNDWNDGINKAGGESIWLAEFGIICLERIKRITGDNYLKNQADAFISKLIDGILKSYNGVYFARIIDKSGRKLGNDPSLSTECSIDILPQCFAALMYLESEIAREKIPKEYIFSSLEFSFAALYDSANSIIKLLDKPFKDSIPSPGYIQKYSSGIRENGGQYTHAAVWFALALLKIGELYSNDDFIKKSIEIYEAISPEKYNDQEFYKKYKREPYVLCGDVYSSKDFAGHGGWSWYTGASGWYYKLTNEIKKHKKPSDETVQSENSKK